MIEISFVELAIGLETAR